MTLVDTKTFGTLDCEMKSVTVKDAAAGTFEAILSMPTVDRDGEVVDAKAFDPLPEYIPIDIDHGMSVESTVGSGQPFYEGDVLKFRGTFASTPLGQQVRSLVLEGHIRKMSVAYMNSVYELDEGDGKQHLRSAELLNAAIVAIPSNREADITGAKGIRPRGTTKAVSGSYEDRADRLRQALRSSNPSATWLWIRATFDDSVVFEVEDQLGNISTYRADYAVDGDSFTFGDATEVDLAEVIVPPVKQVSTDPEAKADPAAQAAGSATEPPADVAVARARIAAAMAELALTP